jgi:hypothetical protein
MMSYLQNSPFASLYGFQPPAAQAGAGLLQQAPQSFQVAPGAQTSTERGDPTNYLQMGGGERARAVAGGPDVYALDKLGRPAPTGPAGGQRVASTPAGRQQNAPLAGMAAGGGGPRSAMREQRGTLSPERAAKLAARPAEGWWAWNQQFNTPHVPGEAMRRRGR